MIDLKRLERIHLRPRPLGQILFANLLLWPNYNLPLHRTRITLTGAEHVPRGGGAVFVMNHTDRYNYWPFQYQLYRRGLGFTATWVKGKYYENALMGRFMDAMNNIPIPSKGYLLTKDFQAHAGRPPTDEEYRVLKRHCESDREGRSGPALDDLSVEAAAHAGGTQVAGLLAAYADQGGYAASLRRRFTALMERVVAINLEALRGGLNLLIFPQGTRSRRLSKGHGGAAQIILHSGAPVIPVGCSGADLCYPGNAPLSRGGEITYRIGAPMDKAQVLAALGRTQPLPDFMPFTESAEPHQAVFQRLTDILMERINELVDPPYRFAEGADEKPSEVGARRFV